MAGFADLIGELETSKAPPRAVAPEGQSRGFMGLARNTLFGAMDVLYAPTSALTELAFQATGVHDPSLERLGKAALPTFAGGEPTFLSDPIREHLPKGFLGAAAAFGIDVLNPAGFVTAPLVGTGLRGAGAVLGPVARGAARVPGVKQGAELIERSFSREGALRQGTARIAERLGLEPEVAGRAKQLFQRSDIERDIGKRRSSAELRKQGAAAQRELAGVDEETRRSMLQYAQRGEQTVGLGVGDEAFELAATDALAKAVEEGGTSFSPGVIRAMLRQRKLDERLPDFIKGGADIPAGLEAQLVRQADDFATRRQLAEMFLPNGATQVDDILAGVQQVKRRPFELAPEHAEFVRKQQMSLEAAKQEAGGPLVFGPGGERLGVDPVARFQELGRDVTKISNVTRKEMLERKVKLVGDPYLQSRVEQGVIGEVTHSRLMHGASVRGTAYEQGLRSDLKLFERDFLSAKLATQADIYDVGLNAQFLDGVLSGMAKEGLLIPAKQVRGAGLEDLFSTWSAAELKTLPREIVNRYGGMAVPKVAREYMGNYIRAFGLANEVGGPLKVAAAVFGPLRTATTMWKRWTLGVIPAWAARNIVSSTFTAMTDAGLYSTPRGMADIPRYMVGLGKSSKAILFGTTNPDMLAKLDRARKAGVIDAPAFLSREIGDVEAAGQAVSDLAMSVYLQQGFFAKAKAMGQYVTGKNLVQPMSSLEASGTNLGARVMQKIGNFGKAVNRVPDIGFFLNNKFEDALKFQHWTWLVERGVPEVEATQRALATVFNVQRMAHFEREYLTLAIPFWNFTRQAIPLSFSLMRKQPGAFANLGVLIRDIEREFRDNVDFEDLPIWLQHASPIRLGRTKQGEQLTVRLESFLPPAEINKLSKVFDVAELRDTWRSALDSVMAMTSPFIQLPQRVIQGANAREYYRQKPVETETSPDVQYLGVRWRPGNPYLFVAMQVRIFNEIDRLNPFGLLGSQAEPGITGVPRSRRDVPPLGRAVQFATGLDVRAEDTEQEQRQRAFAAKRGRADIVGRARANARRGFEIGDIASEAEERTRQALKGRR